MGSTTTGQDRKPMLEVAGAPILIHSLRRFDRPDFQQVLIPARPEDVERIRDRVASEKLRVPVAVLSGGDSRQDSVWCAIRHLLDHIQGDPLVAVHDAVRPFVETAIIDRVLEAAGQHGAAIVALPAVDTIKQVERAGADTNRVVATLPRERIVLAQTPQVARLSLLRRAYEAAQADGFKATDEASLLEHIGVEVYVVPGSARNWKITLPSDLPLAELFLAHEARSASFN